MQSRSRKTQSKKHGVLWTALFGALLLGCFALGIGRITDSASSNEKMRLNDAIRRALVTCYAIEGRYPASLEQLCRDYGIAYDADRYFVLYEAFSENLMPDVTVVGLGGGQ